MKGQATTRPGFEPNRGSLLAAYPPAVRPQWVACCRKRRSGSRSHLRRGRGPQADAADGRTGWIAVHPADCHPARVALGATEMTLSPPKFGNPMLPWKLLPPWLQFLRVLFFIAAAGAITCLSATSALERRVLASPREATGQHIHPTSYKGTIFYLSDPFFNWWTALSISSISLLTATGLLGSTISTVEYRIKRQRWNAWLDGVAEVPHAEDRPAR